jgi:hypothetical protein
MPIGRHAHLELLDTALQPLGELEARDVPFVRTSKVSVTGSEASDQSDDVKDRTLARSVGTAQHAEGVEFSLEGDEAAEQEWGQP